uniref:Protein eyes shut n=1 Tax=Apteryx owenii TaxID=8824 RepID=A0A8B9NZ42_APTOW
DINECDSEPCLNGATCYESVIQGQFVCICPPFYTGDFCHQHFSPCDLPYNPCINNSTCLAQVDGNPLCICKTGFEGTNCEVNTDECASHPCQHQGLCVDGVNHYKCSCQHGFTGTLCEVEINECLSRPCKNNGACLDLINRFLCNCVPGYYGSLCEMDVNECETLPCLHGGSCINRLGGYQCFCTPGFTAIDCTSLNCNQCFSPQCLTCNCSVFYTGDRCEINIDECISTPCLNNGNCIDDISSYKCHCNRGFIGTKCEINECESVPCINGGSCQDLDNAFVCTCLSGYTGEFCEVDIDVCSEPALNSALCYNGGICVDGPGRIFRCRCLDGFSGQFCEIEVNECNSSPCLHGSTCEDHINGYTCKCQQGWEGLHCELDVDECISSPCIHGICVQREPSFGYTCFCKPGFLNYNDCLIQSCSTGFLCIDGINNITCLPTIPQSKQTVTEMAEVFPTEILDDDLSSALSVSLKLWSKETGIFSCEILLTNNLAKLSYGLGGLIATGESSAVFRIATSTDVLSSQFLSSAVQVSLKIKLNITPVPYVAIGTSIELMSLVLPQDNYDTASFITSSLMALSVFPAQVSSLQQHQTVALSATDMSSVISSIPGAEIELNSHSLLSHGLQFTTTSASATSVLFRLFQKSLGELSDVFSVSEEHWRLPSSSITPHFCTKTFISKQISFLSSLVMHKSQMQTSLPSEYLAITASSINQRLTNIKSQSADSLSKLSQICATCFMTGLKPSGEFLDQVLHSKQSPFYETFWMNSVILTSWYTLMGATAITSGTHASLRGGAVLPLSSQESDAHFPCFDSDCVTIFPSQAISLEPSLSTHTSSQEIYTDLTKRLTAADDARYYGDSYLEFQGLHLNTQNFIHLEFKTYNPHGLLLYIEQSPETVGHFLIQLFIKNGTLQYQFLCDEAAEVRNINTTARVDDGRWYKMPGPAYNFTGCVEVIEINNVGPFNFSNAVGRNNIDNYKFGFMSSPSPPTHVFLKSLPVVPSLISPQLPSVCQEGLCRNGGTCHATYLPTGATSFQCDCPLHFTGRFCEKDAALFFPSFSGNSYLELPSLIYVSETRTASGQETGSLTTLYLTVKTTALNGTILYTGEKNFGEQFLHLYVVEGRPTVRFSCGQSQNILTVSINQSISSGVLIPITISYMLPVGSPGGYCMIEMSADGNPPVQHRLSLSYQASQITFGSIFLGNVPVHAEVHRCAGQIHGYKGCVRDFQVNNKELFIIDEALGGRNVENCNVPICDYNPCRNGGTCTSDAENWFCECPKLYSGKLCQFMACDENPCGNGATCFPKSKQDTVCLCPYGRSGILCKDAINISQPSFSGTDVFGYTSFLAYSTIPNITFYYEFRLKFQLVNHHSALKDNLIFFTGQKGQGLNGDDFLVLGLRNGKVVYSYNLGSGTASIISKPLDLTLSIHVIHLGRSLQKGWLKVDDQKNRTVTSPGGLVGLNVFSQFYLGGYHEYTPELLPKGSRFKNSFQGCVFDVQVRTNKNQEFKSPGTPEGHPNAGRSVGQCKGSPCSLIKCRNGGKCIESGSTVYCDCLTGWKGAFCTETMSICDPEHDPPHLCKQGGTCVPLPNGYTCHCPLGTTGTYCERGMEKLKRYFLFYFSAVSISDPSFRSNESSWMSFAPFYIRHKTHIKLQFQPLSPDGILFYAAQRLNTQSGDFLCISLVNGFIQLRYNLGDKTVILQTFQKVHTNGNRWHSLRAGRVGNEGYLDLDGVNVTQKATAGMNALDTHTDFFVGGVSSLNLVNSMATENEPTGFSGCIREILINNRELKLTVTDPKDGANVGDCDGTACGYAVCKNNGTCQVEGSGFSCSCPQQWIGNRCEQSIYCSENRCGSQALCIPQPILFSYICVCALGWSGKYCDNKITFFTVKFVGNSYIKYIDPHYGKRDLQHSRISLNFTTNQTEGLILWMGKAEDEDNDFLALGIANGTLKIVVNLGERISVPLIYSKFSICCGRWHVVTIVQNQTCIKVYLDEDLILFEDIDPQRKYTALNYGGICYFGGFEIGREVNIVTTGLFQQEFIGRIKDVVLFQDSKKIQLMKAEGYNIYNGDDGN